MKMKKKKNLNIQKVQNLKNQKNQIMKKKNQKQK